MKTNLYRKLLIFSILAVASLGFVGCGDDITEQYFTGTEIKTYYFEVKATDDTNVKDRWKWNPEMGRFECVFDLPALNQKIYEEGIVQAGVFYNEWISDTEYYETLKNLQFERTYWDEETQKFYTEFINFDVALDPSTICFYIQTSNGIGYADFLSDYEFKVSLLWDPNKR